MLSPSDEAEEYNTAKDVYNTTADSGKYKPVHSNSTQNGHSSVSKPQFAQTSVFNASVKHTFLNDRKPKPAAASQQMRSVATQATFSDEEIFPALDYRRCSRCGKNDAISPGVCLYKSRNVSHHDNPNMITLKSKDKVAYSHTYKEDPHANDGDLIFFKPSSGQSQAPTAMNRDAGVQTIVGIAEVRLMNRGPLQDFKYVEKVMLSPKD